MKNESKKTRTECDLLGCVEVPDNVLYGVQTMRGLENFAISKFRLCEYPVSYTHLQKRESAELWRLSPIIQ